MWFNSAVNLLEYQFNYLKGQRHVFNFRQEFPTGNVKLLPRGTR